ncbi:MAG: hypothetical protein Q8P20_02550 [bacterium]|nr:hypothetical protein [bacterium]
MQDDEFKILTIRPAPIPAIKSYMRLIAEIGCIRANLWFSLKLLFQANWKNECSLQLKTFLEAL